MPGELEVRMTDDGSATLFNSRLKETYHSVNGAINESMHVFIRAGLHNMLKNRDKINILEIGLGTGLNLILTYLESLSKDQSIEYITIEPYPVENELLDKLNYPSILPGEGIEEIYNLINHSPWGKRNEMNAKFHFMKIKSRFEEVESFPLAFDLVYFDAFSPNIQPELWEMEVFKKIAENTHQGGVLVTYSAKGQVRRNLQQAGFVTERIPGPRGKREMTRATKK